MVFEGLKEKLKCEICDREFEFETIGIPRNIIHEVRNLKNGETIGIMLGGYFICKDCFGDVVAYIISLYRKSKEER